MPSVSCFLFPVFLLLFAFCGRQFARFPFFPLTVSLFSSSLFTGVQLLIAAYKNQILTKLFNPVQAYPESGLS